MRGNLIGTKFQCSPNTVAVLGLAALVLAACGERAVGAGNSSGTSNSLEGRPAGRTMWGPVVGTRLLEVCAAEVKQGVKGECRPREPKAQN